MIVGLDLDATISGAPEFFAMLTNALVAGGHEVHVITFRDASDRAATVAELEAYGIAWTRLLLPPDEVSDPPSWKAEVARRLGLDAMFEDSPEVLAAMPAGVKRFWLADPAVFDLERCVAAPRR